MDNIKVKDIFKKYTMIIALILVILFFQIGTGGKILFAQNINNLISQNAYVFVLATGMLCCILVTPIVTTLIGIGAAWVIAPPIGSVASAFGQLIMRATDLQPFWMGILVSVLVGVVFGLLPANRGVKISALEAIKHD